MNPFRAKLSRMLMVDKGLAVRFAGGKYGKLLNRSEGGGNDVEMIEWQNFGSALRR